MEIRKAMLSQPMAGKTDEEIEATRNRAIADLKSRGFEIVNTLFTDEWYNSDKMKERGVVQIPLCFLAKSLENMSLCHAAYFCKGWEEARGCRIEHEVATAYGMEIIYEGVGTYNTKPSIVRAIQWTSDNTADVDGFTGGRSRFDFKFGRQKLIITDRDNKSTFDIAPGDYIIKGENGELSVCSPEKFKEKYEEVSHNG